MWTVYFACGLVLALLGALFDVVAAEAEAARDVCNGLALNCALRMER